MKILLCYFRSEDAEAAIQVIGELYRTAGADADVEVLTVWDGFAEVVVRAGGGIGAAALDFEKIDAECEHAARLSARAGRGAGTHVRTQRRSTRRQT